MYSQTPFEPQLLAAVCPYRRKIALIGLQMVYLVSLCPQLFLHTFDGSVIERWVKSVERMNSCAMWGPM